MLIIYPIERDPRGWNSGAVVLNGVRYPFWATENWENDVLEERHAYWSIMKKTAAQLMPILPVPLEDVLEALYS